MKFNKSFVEDNTNLGFRIVKSRTVNFYLTFVHTNINVLLKKILDKGKTWTPKK
jgi:hypothetical protein